MKKLLYFVSILMFFNLIESKIKIDEQDIHNFMEENKGWNNPFLDVYKVFLKRAKENMDKSDAFNERYKNWKKKYKSELEKFYASRQLNEYPIVDSTMLSMHDKLVNEHDSLTKERKKLTIIGFLIRGSMKFTKPGFWMWD